MGNCSCRKNDVVQHPKENEHSTSPIDLKEGFSQKGCFSINKENQRSFMLNGILYVEQKLIGSGGFSDVYLYQNQNNNKQYALKILKDHSTKDALLHEYRLMSSVRSQFVIQLEDSVEIDDKFCILMEYANQGTLGEFIQSISNQTQKISASQILDLSCDIFSGLQALHSMKIIHRDLKMENILVSNFQIKIADLGVATYLIAQSYAQTNVGNLLYAAPEKQNEDYNQSSDIYSAGLIILQIILGISGYEILKLKINESYLDKLKDCPESLKNFLLSLLDKNPKFRPSAIDAYNQGRMLKFDQQVLSYLENKISGNESTFITTKKEGSLQSSYQTNYSFNQLGMYKTKSVSDQKEDTLFSQGMNLFWQGAIAEADSYFTQILSNNPASVQGLSGQILCQIRYLDFINKKNITRNQIKDKIDLVLQINQNYYLIYFCLALLDGDIIELNNCIELNPNMVEAIAFQAVLYADLQQNGNAIKTIQQALNMSENNAFVLMLAGKVYSKIDKETSNKYYQKSLEYDRNNYLTYYDLYQNYIDSQLVDLALHYLIESINNNPYYLPSIKQLVIQLSKKKQYREVINIISKLFRDHVEVFDLYEEFATAYHESGDNNNALLYYQKILLQKQDPKILDKIGTVYKELGQYEKAKQSYLKAIDQEYKASYLHMYYLLDGEYGRQDYLHELLQLYFDEQDEEDCFLKLKAYNTIGEEGNFIDFSQVALVNHPNSEQIKNYILDYLKFGEIYFIDEQFKISEMIQNTDGMRLENLICSIKYLQHHDMVNLISQHIQKYFETIVKRREELSLFHDLIFKFFDFHNQFSNLRKIDERNIISAAQSAYHSNPANIYCQYLYVQAAYCQYPYEKDYNELSFILNNLNSSYINPLQSFIKLIILQTFLFSSTDLMNEIYKLQELVELYSNQSIEIKANSNSYFRYFNYLSNRVNASLLQSTNLNSELDLTFYYELREKIENEKEHYHPYAPPFDYQQGLPFYSQVVIYIDHQPQSQIIQNENQSEQSLIY